MRIPDDVPTLSNGVVNLRTPADVRRARIGSRRSDHRRADPTVRPPACPRSVRAGRPLARTHGSAADSVRCGQPDLPLCVRVRRTLRPRSVRPLTSVWTDLACPHSAHTTSVALAVREYPQVPNAQVRRQSRTLEVNHGVRGPSSGSTSDTRRALPLSSGPLLRRIPEEPGVCHVRSCRCVESDAR
jgi:hypothetical protein